MPRFTPWLNIDDSALIIWSAKRVLVGPVDAHKTPIKPEQLKAYQDAFMEEVRKGDLLFHGDEAMAKQMGVVLSNTGMACAMCHPQTADTHPHTFPKFQRRVNFSSTWIGARAGFRERRFVIPQGRDTDVHEPRA